MAYNDPIPPVTPEERERNLNRSIDQVWADAEESRMDKLGETLRKVNAEEERDFAKRYSKDWAQAEKNAMDKLLDTLDKRADERDRQSEKPDQE
jgi:hypothetical protein